MYQVLFVGIQIQDGGWPSCWKYIAISQQPFDWFSRRLWNSNASWPSGPDWSLKIQTFKNPRWQIAAILKIEEIMISQTIWPALMHCSSNMFLQPLVSCRSVVYIATSVMHLGPSDLNVRKNFNITESKVVDGSHLENGNIVIPS